MKIGVVKEIKDKEARVALTPAGAAALIEAGHSVLVEENAGLNAGFPTQEYADIGARIQSTAGAWAADMVMKVKEPLESEYPYLHGQMVFTYFHLAGAPPALTEVLLERQCTAIAYETLEDAQGKLPLLAPMSAVAGNMAVWVGCHYLARHNGGRGVQPGLVLGKRYGKVVILGDGVVGRHAARTASGIGTNTFLATRHPDRDFQLEANASNPIESFASNPRAIGEHLKDADLVIGAVLQRGARAPHLVTEAMVKNMRPGAVIVDVSIDQGGCVETSRPTSHSDPVFVRHGVIHYCVTNMPGAYPRTSTMALTAATLPYALRLANEGLAAMRKDAGFARAVNAHAGYVTYRAIAEALGMIHRYRDFDGSTN